MFPDGAYDLVGYFFEQGGRLVHPLFDDGEEGDVVDEAFDVVERAFHFVIHHIEVDFEGIAGGQFFFVDAVAAGEEEVVQSDGDHILS